MNRSLERLAASVVVLAGAAALAACSGKSDASSASASGGSGAAAEHIRIVTSAGTITATLDPAHAPKTVANFNHYIDTKFFDGGSFFRAVPGFVIQGGNKPKETPSDPTVELEDPQTTGLKNLRGSLAMARTPDPNSGTSEFFIDVGDEPALDGGPGQPGYAVFGKVDTGMDVVDKIVAGPAQAEMLIAPIKIVSISRIR